MNAESIALTIFFVFCFTAFLTWLSFLQKQSSWTGKVINKIYEEAKVDDSGSTDEQFKLVCKTTEGKKVTIGVFKNDYESYEIGDRLEKKKGEYMPTKIS